MIAKAWMALAFGAALMFGAVTTTAALGNMNGDCDQLQEKLQDGSCGDCPCTADVELAGDGTCDECNDYDYDWSFLYESPGPHQSSVGGE